MEVYQKVSRQYNKFRALFMDFLQKCIDSRMIVIHLEDYKRLLVIINEVKCMNLDNVKMFFDEVRGGLCYYQMLKHILAVCDIALLKKSKVIINEEIKYEFNKEVTRKDVKKELDERLEKIKNGDRNAIIW